MCGIRCCFCQLSLRVPVLVLFNANNTHTHTNTERVTHTQSYAQLAETILQMCAAKAVGKSVVNRLDGKRGKRPGHAHRDVLAAGRYVNDNATVGKTKKKPTHTHIQQQQQQQRKQRKEQQQEQEQPQRWRHRMLSF